MKMHWLAQREDKKKLLRKISWCCYSFFINDSYELHKLWACESSRNPSLWVTFLLTLLWDEWVPYHRAVPPVRWYGRHQLLMTFWWPVGNDEMVNIPIIQKCPKLLKIRIQNFDFHSYPHRIKSCPKQRSSLRHDTNLSKHHVQTPPSIHLEPGRPTTRTKCTQKAFHLDLPQQHFIS